MADVRLGLIGCGRIAERGYIPALRRAEGLRLAAVADPVAKRRERAAPGIPGFRSAAELLEAQAADALVLATPVAAHLPDARLAAEYGIPVLIEKPPARTAGEAAELAALSPSPWIAFNRRFEPELRALRRAAETAGRVEVSLLLRARKGSWRAYEVDDDVLLNLGPHLVDLAFWISRGAPEEVTGRVDDHRALLNVGLGERGTARIRAGLLSYRDPDGEPAVLAVDRTRDVFGEGKRSDLLPDLVVRWSERPSNGVDYVTSSNFGEVRRPGSGSGRSGAHLPQAWAVVAPGSSSALSKSSPTVGDIVPTVCSVLRIDAEELPGSPLLAPS